MATEGPEIRRNAVTGHFSILAEGRARRPGAFDESRKRETYCPFCPGNEDMTPPEIWALGRDGGEPDTPGWKVRLIPNLFPALLPDLPGRGWRSGTMRGMPSRGFHEVIIHSPHHQRSFGELDTAQTGLLMEAYRRRFDQLARLDYIRQVMIVLNQGREAGASIEHPHSQIFALPVVPRAVREELRETRRYSGKGCLLCAQLREAEEDGRLVVGGGPCAAFTPYASRVTFETWFLPRRHEGDFRAASDGELAALGEVISQVIGALNGMVPDLPYNLFLHSSPCDGGEHGGYHWHLELIPRLIRGAGFEMGTGMYLNILDPANAAVQLRGAIEGEGG